MAYIYDLTDTWNASGTTFNGIKLNVTDSASASSSKLVTLQTNGTEHFSITKAGVGYVSGNLGVGTSSPAVKLDVVGAGVFRLDGSGSTTPLILRNNNTASTQLVKLGFDSSGAIKSSINAAVYGNDYMTFNVGSDTERMRINSSGNVGIGTSSPSSRLTITGGTTEIRDGNYLMLRPVGNGWDMRLQATGTQLDVLSGGAPGSPIMSLVNGGNVGIGTSSPTTRLQIGDIGATDATFQGRIKLEDTSTSLQTVGGLEYVTSSFGAGYGWKINSIDSSGVHLVFGTRQNSATWTETMRMTSGGFLLVGTTAPLGGNTSSEFKVTGAGSWPLTLNANDRGLLVRNSAAGSGIYAYFEYNGGTNNGSISWSGGTTAYNTTSDARIKDNIVDAPDAGDLIDAIQVRSWDFKADGAHWRYGMVAQELLEVAPEAVNKPEDEEMMMGVDYSKLVPMLIKEVQSLRARVAQLEGN